jgi:low affinity Fe/Cu permease
MNLDELKTVWLEYDRRLQATEEINQKIVVSMIRARSVSRIARIRRFYFGLIALFLFYSVCFIFCLIGNPFDYTTGFEFVPLALLTSCSLVLVVILLKANLNLKKMALEGMNLQQALEEIIVVYSRYRQMMKYAVAMMQASSVMVILSFLPRRIPEAGLGMALLTTFSPLIVLLVYFYFAKKGGWKPGDAEKSLRADLAELKEFTS